MPREWRFNARWAAWRPRCATPDADRLLAEVTDAFVDRAPIDWLALRTRTHEAERAVVDNLHLVDDLRRASRAGDERSDARGASPALYLITNVALLQSAVSLALLVVAAVHGHLVSLRPTLLLPTLTFGAAAAFLSASARRDPRRLSLAATFACAGSAFARALLKGVADPAVMAIEPLLRALWCEAFTPACLWHFALHFPRVRRFTRFDVIARRVAAAVGLVAVTAWLVNLGVACHALDERAFASLLPNHANNAFWRLFALAMIPAIGAIFVRARRAPRPERRKVLRFAQTLALGVAPFLAHFLLRVVAPPVDRWLATATPDDRAWVDILVVGALTATPLLCTVAVVVDRPFALTTAARTRSRSRRAARLLTAVTAVPFLILVGMLYVHRREPLDRVLFHREGWWLLACAIAGTLLLAARPRLLARLERRDRRQREIHHQQLARALERARLACGAREVTDVVVRELRDGIGARSARLLVEADGHFVDRRTDAEPLRTDTALVAMLRAAAAPLDLSPDRPLVALLPAAERAWTEAQDIELMTPVRRRDGAVAAIVTVGAKRGSAPYDDRDRWFLTMLVGAATGAWDADDRGADATAVHDDEREPALECPACGRVVEAGPLLCCGREPLIAALPATLGGTFVVQRRLGAGGMGVVYLARDLRLDRDVVLKTLPELRAGVLERAGDERRLRDEARAMAALSHDGLAAIHGLERWRRTPVLVMPYFPAGTLAQRLADGPLPVRTTMAIGLRLAQALAHVHAQGLLHRDIKPSNIALTATGAPKLLDFGLATLAGPAAVDGHPDRHDLHELAGTPAYLPPEAFDGAAPSVAFDLWALSVVLLESVTGSHPFAGRDLRETRDRLRHVDVASVCAPLAAEDPDLPGFLTRALARTPAERFPTADALHAALDARLDRRMR